MERNPLIEAGSKTLYTLIGLVAVVVVIAGIIAGIGVLASLFTAALLAVVIYVGSFAELAGSLVVGCMLKMFTAEIHSFVGIWWTGASADKFWSQVASTGYFNLIAVMFFISFTVSFFTSRVRFIDLRHNRFEKQLKGND